MLLASLITCKITLGGHNLRDDLRKIQNSLNRIRAVLEFAETLKHPMPRGIPMHKLKKVASEAENVIDELTYQILRPKVKTFSNRCILSLKNVKLSLHVINLNREIEKAKVVAMRFESLLDDPIIPQGDFDRLTDLVVDNSIVGREADVSKIVHLLTRSSHQRLLTVVPIVGMAGLGKTALAKLVFRRVMALNLFDVQMWVCVSQKCDGELQILGLMLQSLNVSTAGSTDKDVILQLLEKELKMKKFLIVLDDVWELVSSEWWDDFMTRLLKICGKNGNVVLVTTRSEELASIVQTSSQHRHTIDFLSDVECWFILKEGAFINVPLRISSNFEVFLGREIAKKCRGVPLAAKVLGGTLGFNRNEGAWLRIRDTPLNARDNEMSLRSILKLSFDHFDSPFFILKSCFAFCSVFPKGFLIVKEDLIHMWMAEGFVDLFDKGNEYFHALLAISFFQDAVIDDDGNVIKCKMNNLVHDFALSVEKNEMHIRYVYADYQSKRTSGSLPKNKVKYLSTVILNGAPLPSYLNSKSLRTLYMNDVDMETLPSSINKLKHFRYLHVSNTKVSSPLPKSITEIYMLQILTLSNCSCEQLPPLGDLPCLKFLTISHMKRVKCIGNESYEGNIRQHELRLFPALKSLSLSWMENLTAWSPPSYGNRVVIFPVLENLSVKRCAKLAGFPMREVSTLVKIEIKDCEELRFLLDDHKSFPSVTSLSIVGCPKLTYLRNWFLSNESYKEFRVRRCHWLKFIPEDLGMQRSLISLQIYCCKRLEFFSEEILCKLTQLRKLSIGAFSEKLDDFHYLNGIKNLTYLEELEIWGSDVFGRKMFVLPNQLQHLYNLQSLKIKGFTAMKVLPDWLPYLPSLGTIYLNYCWHLEHQSTSAIIQRASNLSDVYIYGCHALEGHKSQWMEFSGTTKIRIHFQ